MVVDICLGPIFPKKLQLELAMERNTTAELNRINEEQQATVLDSISEKDAALHQLEVVPPRPVHTR